MKLGRRIWCTSYSRISVERYSRFRKSVSIFEDVSHQVLYEEVSNHLQVKKIGVFTV